MRIYGLDFTSAPSYRKPITCAVCTMTADRLRVEGLIALTSMIELWRVCVQINYEPTTVFRSN